MQYKAKIQEYFGDNWKQAIFVADKESIGCTASKSLKPNSDGTIDYCIFMINQEPQTAKNLDHCVKRAFDKFKGGRIGSDNWSAWYSVCTPGNDPKPKYKSINCK